MEYKDWIGKKIKKRSNTIEIVKNITVNPYTNKEAFLLSDDSVVDC